MTPEGAAPEEGPDEGRPEPTTPVDTTTGALTASTAEPPAAPPAPSSPLRRERAAAGPALGRGLAGAVVAAATLPAIATLWLLASGGSDGVTAPAVVAASPAATSTTPTTPTTPAPTTPPGSTALRAALDALDEQAAAAAAAQASLQARLDVAEGEGRLRQVQKLVARARDARRAAGKTGPALKGPFPVDELGDRATIDGLGLSASRWLVTREGVVLMPAGTTSPVRLATTGRDEDAASFDATIDGRPVRLQRRCVPFEPYCIVDVTPTSPPPTPTTIDTAPLRAMVLTTPTTTSAPAAATTPPPPPAPTASSSTTPTAAPPPWLALLLALVGVVLAVVVARRLHRLGSALKGIAWRLQAGPTDRASAPAPHGVAELEVLERAVDDALAATARLGTIDDDAAWRRTRLERAALSLLSARDRGGLEPLADDARDDAATARVIGATNDLLQALDNRHRRFAVALTEVDGTVRLITPLAQRLLRLARVDGLPVQAAEELESLGSALGQRARRPQVLAPLLQDLAPLTPTSASIIEVAAAVQPLGEDGVRLAARQLEAASEV